MLPEAQFTNHIYIYPLFTIYDGFQCILIFQYIIKRSRTEIRRECDPSFDVLKSIFARHILCFMCDYCCGQVVWNPEQKCGSTYREKTKMGQSQRRRERCYSGSLPPLKAIPYIFCLSINDNNVS